MQLARAASSHQYLPRNAEDDQQQQQDGPGASTSAAAAGPSSKRKATHPPPPASAAKNTRRRRKEVPEEAQAQTHEEGESYATSDVPPNTMKHDDDDQQQQQVSPEEAATAAAAAAAVWAHRHGQSQHYQSRDDQQYGADASHHHTTEHQLDPNLSPLGNVNDHPPSDPSLTHHHNLSIDNPAISPSQDTGAGITLEEQDQADAEAEAEALRDGNPRVLRTTKRAAQNRAAQRAFRERRDRHIKDLETRASQFDALQALYGDVQARYGEALAIIAALKRENEQLRGGGAGSAGSSEHDVMNQDHGRGLDAVASAAVEAARMAGHEEPSQTQDSAPQGE